MIPEGLPNVQGSGVPTPSKLPTRLELEAKKTGLAVQPLLGPPGMAPVRRAGLDEIRRLLGSRDERKERDGIAKLFSMVASASDADLSMIDAWAEGLRTEGLLQREIDPFIPKDKAGEIARIKSLLDSPKTHEEGVRAFLAFAARRPAHMRADLQRTFRTSKGLSKAFEALRQEQDKRERAFLEKTLEGFRRSLDPAQMKIFENSLDTKVLFDKYPEYHERFLKIMEEAEIRKVKKLLESKSLVNPMTGIPEFMEFAAQRPASYVEETFREYLKDPWLSGAFKTAQQQKKNAPLG